MSELGPLAVAWRLAVTLFVVVTPTLLFLGLLRGLERLRDDRVIEGYVDSGDLDVDDTDELIEALTEGTPVHADTVTEERETSPSHPPAGPTVRCPHCDAVNREDVTYCQQCLESVQ